MKPEFKILSATAILGYGFPRASFERGMALKPDLIAADAGSSDPGPYYLGAGKSFTDHSAVKRDLEIMITEGVKNKVPVIIGTAGGSGANPHVDWTLDIVKEIAKEQNIHFKLAVIRSELEKDLVLNELEKGNIVPFDEFEPLSPDDVQATSHIVAQMGVESFEEAIKYGPDVIIAGRSYDPSVFAALPISKGYDEGLATHLGKILECASICATPGSGSDCMMGFLGEDYFRLEPLSDARICTTTSVAAHTLYEKTNPYILPGPGGHLDLTNCTFEQTTDKAVTVRGTKFVPSKENTVKLEGSKRIGYRTVSIAGARDPIFISEIDTIIQGVKDRVEDNFDGHIQYNLRFVIYGRDGVMGVLEPDPSLANAHEIGIVIEAIADTQADANTICSFARSTMLHYGYPGRKATAGNLALPYSPSDFQGGEVYVFSIYHLLKTENPASLFPIEILEM